MSQPYAQGLERNPANHAALTPVSFLAKAAAVYPDRLAVVHGEVRRTWAQTFARCRQLASALQRRGVQVVHTRTLDQYVALAERAAAGGRWRVLRVSARVRCVMWHER